MYSKVKKILNKFPIFIKFTLIVSIVLFLIWINIPSEIPVKWYSGKTKILDFKIPKASANIRIEKLSFVTDFAIRLGLDLKGGISLIFEADTSLIKKENVEDALSSVRNIIEKRVNLNGTSEPNVRMIKSGNANRIAVDLPGEENIEKAVALIGSTAQLEFKEEASTSAKKVATTAAERYFETLQSLTNKTGLTGKDIKRAYVETDRSNGQPVVALEFTSEGGNKFAKITKRNVGKPVGIYIDNMLLSAPTVQQEIITGVAQISGNFTEKEARQYAVNINSGALPVPIKLVQQQLIGPTLGENEIKKSIFAGIVGLAMVMLFMLLYYGRLGVIACIALTFYALLSLFIFRTAGFVLTLPGIAGLILSIGMAVDSNILIFERIKDELKKNRTFSVAVRLGFGRAIDAIKDANVTTILICLILFNPLGIFEFLPQFGMVRGFALTLMIGVLTSLFTGIVITKRLIRFFYKDIKKF